MANARILGNVGSQQGGLGRSIVFLCEQISNGAKFLAQVEKKIDASGTPVNPVVLEWKFKNATWARTTGSSLFIDPRVNLSTLLETKATWVGGDDVIPDAEFSNAGSLKQATNPNGTVAILSLLGDGVSATFLDNLTPIVDPTVTPSTLPPAVAVPTGVVASISTFISENPITSFLIALFILVVLYFVWQYMNDEDHKPKKKKRRS